MAFGFGHLWILILTLFLLAQLAAAIVAIIVVGNVLTYRLINRKKE